MIRLPRASLLLPIVLLVPALLLAAPAGKPVAKAPARPTARKPAPPPPPEPPAEPLSPGQLDAAGRVFTGKASCEFDNEVQIQPIEGKPGHFRLGWKKSVYTLIPQETSTGAVRLEDRKAGVVWLQIPSKSMLMNAKLGQRLVDSCLNEAQRGEAVLAAAAAAPSIGIAAVPAEPPPAAPTVVVVPVSGPATPAPAALPGWMGPASPPASPASAADQPAPEAPPAPGPAASAPN